MIQRRTSSSLVFVNYVEELRRQIVGVIALLAIALNTLVLFVLIANQQPIIPELLVLIVIFSAVLVAVVRRLAMSFVTNAVFVLMLVFMFQLDILLAVSMIALNVLFTSPLLVNRLVYGLILVVVPARVLSLEWEQLLVEGITFGSPLQYLTGALVVSVLLRVFRERLDAYLENARENSELIQRANEFSRLLTAYTTDETVLLQQAVNILKNQLGFDVARVYLVQPSNEAVLAAATDGAPVGERSSINTRTIVGRALLSGETITLRGDLARAREGLAALQAAQAVIPLIDRERVIGALELQSTANFTVDRLNALQVVANSLTQALQRTRTFQEQQATLQQVRRITQENEANLRELDRLNRQLTRQTWAEYVELGDTITGVTLRPDGFSPGATWTAPMLQAVQRRRSVNVVEDGKRVVAVPIELRGEVIGALHVALPERHYDAEVDDLIRAVAQRLAISLENARLFEEAQAATIQEQRINEIIAEMQTSDTLETMLQRALEGLSEALGTADASIRLGSPIIPTTNGGHHAS